MKRLAVVRQRYNAAGGAERFVSRALEALSTWPDLQISLIARSWKAPDKIQAITANPFYLGSLWRDWGFARSARKIWRQQKFDLIQSHERIPGCDIYRAGDGVHRHWLNIRRRTLPLLKRLGLVLSPYHRYVQWAEKQMFLDPRLKQVICNSHMVKQQIQQYFGLPDEKFAIIYNGVDTEFFHPGTQSHRVPMREKLQIPQNSPLLLYVGSGFARKGLEVALKALADFPDLYLVIVGNDKRISHYKSMAASLGTLSRVRFSGPQNDVRPYYGMADAFILPTFYDPFPNVCIEALACGLPVFTTHQCGAAELIKQGENGWVSDVFSPGELRRQLESWLNSPQRWPQQRSAARRSVESLTLTAMATQMHALYTQLLLSDTKH